MNYKIKVIEILLSFQVILKSPTTSMLYLAPYKAT